MSDLCAMWYPNLYCKGVTPQSAITGTDYSVTLTGSVHGGSCSKELYTQSTSGTYGAIVDHEPRNQKGEVRLGVTYMNMRQSARRPTPAKMAGSCTHGRRTTSRRERT